MTARQMQHRPLAPALAWLAMAMTAGCAHAPNGPPAIEDRALATIADRHRIIVSATETTLQVPLAGGAESFDPETRNALLGFVRRYAAEGDGPLVLSAPGEGPAADAGARRAEALQETLATLGVPETAIAPASHADPSPEAAKILLTFTRYVARAPACRPLWEQNLAFSPQNTPWESFGCATQANLAAMIADPRDLDRPKGEAPADAFRRQSVLDRYRQGQSTHAERSEQESVGISDAIK